MKSTEQRLIDIMFEVAMLAAECMHGKTDTEITDWVARQLKACGFETKPMGCSWGVLVEKEN